jgi:hypothetical protein
MLPPTRAPAARPRLYLTKIDVPSRKAARPRYEVLAFRDPSRGRAYARWPWWSPTKPDPRTRAVTLDRQTWDAIWLPTSQQDFA